MYGWKVSVLPFNVIVDVAWYGKCSRDEPCLDSLPYQLNRGRGRACSGCTVIEERSDVDFVEACQSGWGRAIGRRVDSVQFEKAEAGCVSDRLVVSLEVEKVVKVDAKKLGRVRVLDDLPIIGKYLGVIICIMLAKDHPNRFGAA